MSFRAEEMALHKGIKVQPSRFAALQLESDSESGEDDPFEVEWHQVGGKSKSKGGAPPSQQKDGPPGARQLSKSAKKRARKKRNQQSTSEVSFHSRLQYASMQLLTVIVIFI